MTRPGYDFYLEDALIDVRGVEIDRSITAPPLEPAEIELCSQRLPPLRLLRPLL